ncbi:MAG: prolipoprotein diacylglyceryl transferase [Bryobacteraceae bacterium]
MLPYFNPGRGWFPALVAAGVVVGIGVSVRRARGAGLNRAEMVNFLWALLLGGGLGAGFGKALYEPDLIRSDPTLVYRYFFGISSFGGILGGLAASAVYAQWRGISWSAYADAAAFAFPFGWTFGRLGCALVHDHPGIESAGWLAVAYPAGSRYDLGLLELLFTLLLAAVWLFWVRPGTAPAGLGTGVLLAAYGLFRFAIDPLHIDPPRYGGISVDQAAGGLTFLIGATIIARTRMRPSGRPPDSAPRGE